MQLLTWLTVIYALVLVLALAVSLITIFVYLWRIGSALGKVKNALVEALDNTEPLQGHLEFVNAGLMGVADELQSSSVHFARVDAALDSVATHLGVREAV